MEIYVLIHDKGTHKYTRTYYENDHNLFQKANHDGWGIYKAINEFEASESEMEAHRVKTPRNKRFLKKLRRVFADLDVAKNGDGQTRKQIDEKKLHIINELKSFYQPSEIVSTANGLQIYYDIIEDSVSEEVVKKYVNVINGIIEWSKKHGALGDKVKDVTRVFRVPGYNHMKGEPYPIEVWDSEPVTSTLDDLAKKFPYKDDDSNIVYEKKEPVDTKDFTPEKLDITEYVDNESKGKFIYKAVNPDTLSDIDREIAYIDIKDIVIKAFASVGRSAEFDNKKRLILDGRLTGTFQGKEGDCQYLASTSHEPFEGNKITVVADILSINNKEARKWIIEEYNLTNPNKIQTKFKAKKIIEEAKKTEEIESFRNPGHIPLTWGTKQLDFLFEAIKKSKHIILSGESGGGKCLGKGTKIIMYNGELKNVEDIVVGDLLMGDDSKPRKVLSLARGREQMYLVKQNYGVDYRVNESHILSLKNTAPERDLIFNGKRYDTKKVLDINILDLLNQHKTFLKNAKGFKVPICFNDQDISIDPYLLGVWLSDGNTNGNIAIHLGEKKIKIKEYLIDFCKKNNLKLTELKDKKCNCSRFSIVKKNCSHNWLLDEFKKLNLIGNKHIPREYINNSYENRFKLLAGLLDGDGHNKKDKNGKALCCFEITQKNQKLAYSIKLLADTLGFKTSIKKETKSIKKINFVGEYYRIHITGDFTDIPFLRHKPKKWTANSRWRNTGIKIEKDIVDDYFGFTIDGNHRFLLEDCTVTHNTTFAFDVARKNAKLGFNVLFLSLEMSTDELIKNKAMDYAGITVDEDRRETWGDDKEEKIQDEIKSITTQKGLNLIGVNVSEPITIELVWQIILEQENKPDLVFIDNLDLIDSEKAENDFSRVEIVSRTCFAMSEKHNIPSVLIHHYNKPKSGKTRTMHSLRGSGKVAHNADIIITVNREEVADTREMTPEESASLIVSQFKSRRWGRTVSGTVYYVNGSFQDDFGFHDKLAVSKNIGTSVAKYNL